MSAGPRRRGEFSRSPATRHDPGTPRRRLATARALRDEWLALGLSTAPADRTTAEAAVTGLYRLVGAPAPDFHWTPSPAAGLRAVLERPDVFPAPPLRRPVIPRRGHDWPVAARLAGLTAEFRRGRDPWDAPRAWWHYAERDAERARTLPPEEALDAGVPLATVLRAAVYEPLDATLRDACRTPLRSGLFADDAVPGVAASEAASRLTWFGQHDAHWVARRDIGARLAGRVGRDHQLDLWAALARSVGWWWPGDGACVMAGRPVEVHTEPAPGARHGALRLHHDDAPAVRYADGTGVHVVHGAPVPRWVLTDPTVERIHRERNIEVRRTAIERLGWDAYIDQAGLRRVASADDPGNPGSRLHLYDAPRALWGRPVRLLLAVNGSVEPDGRRRRYGLSVPAYFDDPLAAAGWSYGLTAEQYALLARRT